VNSGFRLLTLLGFEVISRDRISYIVKVFLKPSPEQPWPIIKDEEIESFNSNLLEGWESHVLVLPQPILCVPQDMKEIHEFKTKNGRLRVYPPFPLNETEQRSGQFKDVLLPEGNALIQSHTHPPTTVPQGAHSQPTPIDGTQLSQGLRIDIETGADDRVIITSILNHIREQTYQWWLLSGENPFLGLTRFGGEISKDFSIRSELRHSKLSKLKASWHGMTETQNLLGLELPLTGHIWKKIGTLVSSDQQTCTGIRAFLDAISSYMQNNDTMCLLHACISIEILCNKERLIRGKKPQSMEKLRTTSPLIIQDDRAMIKKMFIDRGHIAHGRDLPPNSRSKENRIEEYMEILRKILNKYIDSVPSGKWLEAASMSLSR